MINEIEGVASTRLSLGQYLHIVFGRPKYISERNDVDQLDL